MMKSYKLPIHILLVVLISVAVVSCDLFEQRDRTLSAPPQVEFFPLSNTVSGNGTVSVNVQLIAEQRASDLPLTVTIVESETSAVEGEHYELPSTSVTIPANASTAPFNITVMGNNVEGDPVVLVLELQGTEEVQAAPNLRRHTLTITGGD